MIRTLIFVFALFVALPAMAAAPKIDQAGADTLKPRIVESLNSFAASFAQSGIQMKQTGDLLVEPAGDYYAVTTPSIALVMPSGVTRTVGMVAINAIPTSDPDVFKVAVALPTPMLDTDASGKNVGSLSFGSQAMNGLWNLSSLSFLELNGDYKNIRDLGLGTQTTIPSMTISLKLSPKGNLWSGPFELIAAGLEHKEAAMSYSVGSLHMRALLSDVDLNVQKDIRAAANTRDPIALKSVAASLVTKLLSRADIIFDAQFVAWQNVVDNKTTSNALKNITLQGTMTDIKTGLANATYTLTADGYSSRDMPAQLSPSHIELKGSASKMPVDKILAASNDADVKTALQNAGTHFIIDTATLDAPGYGLEGNGDITPSAAAPMGVGRVHLALRGLDALTTYLSSPEGAAAIGPNMNAGNLLAVLAMVQMTGAPAKDSKGRDVRSYDLVMSADGHIALNGNDMTAVSQGLSKSGSAAPVINLNQP